MTESAESKECPKCGRDYGEEVLYLRSRVIALESQIKNLKYMQLEAVVDVKELSPATL